MKPTLTSSSPDNAPVTPEHLRLAQSEERSSHWKRWGPYLSERAWGTVREDYSPGGTAWEFVSHEASRSKAYRWNEDGIAGISDRHQKICFAVAMWNERDGILKERPSGLTGNEGNHGEDVKECYYYTPRAEAAVRYAGTVSTTRLYAARLIVTDAGTKARRRG